MPRAHDLKTYIEKAGALRKRVRADDVKLMLAETRDEPFTGDGWLFELKHDGFRLLAAREEDARLVYRRGSDATHVFPEIARAVQGLPFEDLVLDGEVVVLDESGRPSFQGLQKRVQLTRRTDLERAAAGAAGHAVRVRPARRSRATTCARCRSSRASRRCGLLMPSAGPLRYADHVEARG